MLAASNIPTDEHLPQLATIASEHAMGALFAAHLEPGWELLRCRIREARYYPGAACLLSYQLKLASPVGEDVVLLLYGRAFGTEPVPEAFRSRPPLATPVGRLPSFLPQLGLALWTFPDDPGMLGLASVWRRGGALFDTPGVLVHLPWGDRRPGLETTVLRYVPAKRCVLRYDHLDHARPEPFFGKVYANEDARALFAAMQAVWNHSQRRAPELLVARPLGCDPRSNAVWQASPGGDVLLEVLETVDLPVVMRRVAAALAALHRADLQPARVWRLAQETGKLERTREALGRFYPALRRDVDAVLGRLARAAPAEATRLVPVHGDFHCNQILVHEDRVAVIDFDLFGRGDPLHDVARFLSRFRAYTHGRLPPAASRRAQANFLGTYEILVPWRVDRRRLGWLMAALLVNRQALKAVKKLSASGPEPVAAMLADVERIAAGRDLE
jgi:hypothetical protein